MTLRTLIPSFFLCLLAALASLAQAQTPPSTSAAGWDAASQGFRRQAKIAVLKPPATARELTREPDAQWTRVLEGADPLALRDFIALDKTRILMVAVDGKVVMTRQASWAMGSATPLGYSMAKSLTSLAVGKLLCQNPSLSLETRGAEILPRFKGTSWGDATLRQVLQMKSGSVRQGPPYTGWQSEPVAAKHRGLYDGANRVRLEEEMRRDDPREFEPGTSYQYNNYDTLFLGLVIEQVSGKRFPEFFQESIWNEVRPAHAGAWLLNDEGRTYNAMGFSASPEDWIRVGYYVIDQLTKDDCFGAYLRQATATTERTHVPSLCYGYQIWGFCGLEGSFFFWGFGGQHLVIAPRRNLVIYTHSAFQATDVASQGRLFRLFGQVLSSNPPPGAQGARGN